MWRRISEVTRRAVSKLIFSFVLYYLQQFESNINVVKYKSISVISLNCDVVFHFLDCKICFKIFY